MVCQVPDGNDLAISADAVVTTDGLCNGNSVG